MWLHHTCSLQKHVRVVATKLAKRLKEGPWQLMSESGSDESETFVSKKSTQVVGRSTHNVPVQLKADPQGQYH
jgi:hypothetical protein